MEVSLHFTCVKIGIYKNLPKDHYTPTITVIRSADYKSKGSRIDTPITETFLSLYVVTYILYGFTVLLASTRSYQNM
jgi:hypothetical protein